MRKPITREEWSRFRWEQVAPSVYLRGIELTEPPDDGFVYVDVTTFSDAKQRWIRAEQVMQDDPD